jgi:hypothetical protein
MEDRMLVHSWREAETIGELTSALEDFIWAELPRGKFSTGMGGENVFGAKPDLLARRECVGWWFVGFKGLFHSAFLHPQSGFGVLTSIAQFTQPRVQGRDPPFQLPALLPNLAYSEAGFVAVYIQRVRESSTYHRTGSKQYRMEKWKNTSHMFPYNWCT